MPADRYGVHVMVPARDDFPLAGTLFQADCSTSRRAVLIAPAMGVRRGFYARFAPFLAAAGFTALTFDYRGTGGSAGPQSRRADIALHDWGELDLSGAIDWLGRDAGADWIGVVAHSVSSQVLGLADNNTRIGGLVLVTPQSGYWRLFGRASLLIGASWYVGVPLVTSLCGRLPGRILGGMDVPKGVAREWACWGRQPDYILAYRPDTRAGFARMTAPLLAYSVTRDVFAPPAAVQTIISWYGSRHREERILSPAAYGGGPIGHFDFFKDRFAATAWREAREWLTAAATSGARIEHPDRVP